MDSTWMDVCANLQKKEYVKPKYTYKKYHMS